MNPLDSHLDPPLGTTAIEQIVTCTLDELAPQGLFSFNAPRQTLMGEGAILKIGALLAHLGVTRVLVVADRVVHEKGLMRSMQRSLERAGISSIIFPGIEREPDETVIARAIELLVSERADFCTGFRRWFGSGCGQGDCPRGQYWRYLAHNGCARV
ncbi:MAG: iron-containing alcohol dehydrogenase [Marinobacter sp.]|nr:iron-containing alcohol dehydrogenase [Marinobacter sp.]